MRAVALSLAGVLALVSCEARPEPQAGPPPPSPSATTEPPASATPEPTRTTTPNVAPPPPAPRASIPRAPSRLAAVLARTHRALLRAAQVWRSRGEGARRLSLEALYQQRIYRLLGRDRRLATMVVDRLPATIRSSAQRNLAAVQALLSLVVPIEPPIELDPTKPAPPDRLLRFYRKGQRQTGIPWQLLASVNFVETRFGRVMGPSTAGALGPMQFLPSTWEQYGGGGDILDPHDSILAAARYLSASGAPADTRSALFAYNRSFEYVDAIQLYAREMMRDGRAFYAYYHWQVFVTTTEGDVQLTGPGGRGP